MSLLNKIKNNRQLSRVLKKTKTTTAAIPAVEDATLQTWIKSIDSAVQAVVKKAVTKGDLVDIGLATINNGNLESLIPKDPDYSPTVPKAVLNLKANGAYSSVTVDWETPPSKLFGHNAVYRSEVDDFGTAIQIGSTLGDVYTDYVGNGIKAYYWVRTISKYDVEGELAPSVYAETSIDIAYLLEQLTGQINASQFDQSLRSKIDSIYTEAAAKIEIEKQIVAERLSVLNAISAESQDRVLALKAQADTLRGEIQQKADDSAQNIRDISQDLAQEILSREGLSQRVDGVASKTDGNTALVGRLEKTFTSKIESIAQEVTLVSAGVGEQFDTLLIYFFDTIEAEETETTSAVWSAEGWTSQGGMPVVSNGWIRPHLNGANTVLISPVVEAFAGSAYSYVRFRIKKVGNPVWIGELVYNNKTLSIPEPTWDALSGIATVNFNAEWVDDISQVKLKLAQLQDGSNYYSLDWFAFGRPSPAASWSAIGEVKQAIATETLARTEKTETIEASISANDTTYRALVQDAVDVAAEANRITGQRVESFILDTTPTWAGSEQGYAGDDGIQVGKWTETSARIEGDLAQAELTEQLFVNINNRVNADVTRIEQVIADKDSAYALEFNGLSAKMVGIPDGANFNTAFTAGIDQLKEAIVDEKGFLATSSLFETLKSDINGETTSQINELKRTYADDTFTQSITYTNLVSGTKIAKDAADDAQLAADNARQAADGAKETADDAKKRADDARKVADDATGKLSDISSDGKLTPLEKQQLKLVWDEVAKTHTELIKRAASYSVSTTAYLPTYNALNTYITPLLSDMTATSNVVRSTFQANFANHYEARAVLGSLIATKAKTLSDDAKQAAVDAQNTADGAGVAASNAKKAADDAKKRADDARQVADEATGKLSDISSDGKLTPLEKQQLKLVWDEVAKTHTELIKRAASYSVSTTAYLPTYNTLSTYVTPLLSDMTATSNVVRSTFQSNFANHYEARAVLGSSIATKAKTLSDDARQAADGAKETADDAKKRADDARQVADEATGKLSDISSDGKLTPLEKQQLKLVWDEVAKTHTELIKRAASYSVSTTAYLPTYTALSTYVTPLLSNMAATSNVVRSTFQSNFANHYEARAVLGSSIATKAKTLSDDAKQAAVDAQNAADSAGVAASNAKKAADDARKVADDATDKLSDIAADGKLTPLEKQQLKLVWDEITKTHTELTKQATSYDLALTTYTPTYTALNTYVTPLLSDTTVTSNIVRSTFQTNFSNHYAARATLANQISVKAKTLADAAKKAADDAQKRADDSFELAGGAKAAIDRYDETYTDKFLAAAESVTKIEASYNTGFAGSTEEYAGSDSYAGGFSIWSAIAEGDLAVSQRTDQLTASFNQSQADYQQQQILVAEELRSLSSTSTTLQANLDKGIGDVKKDIATIQEDMVTVVDEKLGTASGKITALEKVVDGQKTSLEIVNAVGDVNLVKHEIAKSRLDKNTADLLLKKASTNTIIGDINKQIAALTLQKGQTGANVAEIDKQLAELNKAKADAQKVVSDIDSQIKQIQDDKKTLDDLLKTDSKIKAQSTIKLDSHGVIASIGLAIEEDGAGTPQSVIAFRSHRFYVVPPDMDMTKGVVPFIIDQGKVIIDVALIKDGSITNAKIGNLAADKITTGSIAADRMKANIVKAVEGQFNSLSAITGTIGTLRTATTGARTEISDNLIQVFDASGRVRVKIGVWD